MIPGLCFFCLFLMSWFPFLLLLLPTAERLMELVWHCGNALFFPYPIGSNPYIVFLFRLHLFSNTFEELFGLCGWLGTPAVSYHKTRLGPLSRVTAPAWVEVYPSSGTRQSRVSRTRLPRNNRKPHPRATNSSQWPGNESRSRVVEDREPQPMVFTRH